MSKRPDSFSPTVPSAPSGVMAQRPTALAPGAPARRNYRLLSWILGVGVLVMAGLLVWRHEPRQQPVPPNEVQAPTPNILAEFQRRRNAGQADADELLGPAPQVPTEAVSKEEADRLNAEFILRGHYTVEGFRADPTPDAKFPRFVLVLKGGDAQPRLNVRNAEGGVDSVQNSISNPDLVVELREGKLRALSFGLHHDANEKQMSPEQAQQLFNAMRGKR